MIYYRVKPEFDNVIVSKKFDILVANELYTVKELRKLEKMYANKGNYTKTEKELEGKARVKFYLMFEPVEISKRRIYWFFGARFEAKAGD